MIRIAACLALLSLVMTLSGCSNKPPAPPESVKVTTPEQTTEETKPVTPEPKPEGSEKAEKLLAQAEADLAAGKVSEVRAAIDELRQIENLPEAASERVAKLESQLTAMTDHENEAERDAALKKAPTLILNGQIDEAAAEIEVAAARQPTDEQRDQITEYRQQIERIRGAQRKLGAWMKLIGSKTRSEVRAAQTQLLEEPEAALPLLIEALKEPGDKQRTLNILETLRQLRRPRATLPVLVGILSRPEQKESWTDAVDTLSKISDDGAGPLLLGLLKSSQDAEQRAMALTALTRVPDPPADTLLSLLPRVFQDDADLPATLMCLAQAVRRHDQTDLIALHGFGADITPEQAQQLAALPARLEALRASPNADAARAARVLSVALDLITPEPLQNIQVINVSNEYPDSPGKMVLDGVWNSADLAKQWYHPLGAESQIVLDLGEEKTVTGVVIWNFNQAGGATRGWKRAEVFVSPTQTALTPVASGFVPMAPGANDAADYSTVIPVPCVTGRYVKLKAAEIWAPNQYTGLAEVQVLGF